MMDQGQRTNSVGSNSVVWEEWLDKTLLYKEPIKKSHLKSKRVSTPISIMGNLIIIRHERFGHNIIMYN